MDYQRAEELINKYWQGNTSLEEEEALRNFLTTEKDLPDELNRVALLMHYLNENSEQVTGSFNIPNRDTSSVEKPDDRGGSPGNQRYLYWRMAASLVVVALLSLLGYFMVTDREETHNLANQEIQDPERAYAYTKASLLLLSGKMNEGMTHASNFKKFKTTQNLITEEK